MLDVAVRRRQGAFQVDAAFAASEVGITALFGPSGSGKSSVMAMVAGLTRPDEGRVLLDGRPLVDRAAGIDLPMEARRVATVFQDGRLFPHLSVRGNLTYGERRTPPAERRITLATVVDLLGIGHLLDRRPARLSGGEKQRVAIGRALLASPRLLLMDEPLAALDTNRKEEVLPFIARLPREVGIPILYVTHSMDEILRLADLLVLMEHGRSAAVGPVETLLNRADLRRLTGRHDPGAVLVGTVAGHRDAVGLSLVSTAAGPLSVPRMDLHPGAEVRVRVLARDVALATEAPRGLSIRNHYQGTVLALTAAEPPYVDVELDIAAPGAAGPVPLTARVTGEAVRDLAIVPGMRLHALVKAVSIAPASVGEHERLRR